MALSLACCFISDANDARMFLTTDDNLPGTLEDNAGDVCSLPVVVLSSIYLITPIAGAKQPGGALKYIPDHTNGIVINTLEPKWLRLGVYIVDPQFPPSFRPSGSPKHTIA